jgi:hypothetical protein
MTLQDFRQTIREIERERRKAKQRALMLLVVVLCSLCLWGGFAYWVYGQGFEGYRSPRYEGYQQQRNFERQQQLDRERNSILRGNQLLRPC